jgi:lipopolysaccharide/colanic/teichoic acid biosynthesis glycosyltransferase
MSERQAIPKGRAAGKCSMPARILDLIVATTGLIVLGPVMLIAGIAIWVESGGPVIFSQRRIGQFGKSFHIHKLRKFNPVASAMGPLSVKEDPRLTNVGRFIELTKINELPQLWNVVKGEMSMVGPRPETPNFADCFSPHYVDVLRHKPGIFGPAQIMFCDEASLYPEGVDTERFYREVLFPIKASIDLAYFPSRTTFSDIRWIVRGALAVIDRRSSRASVAQLIELKEASL